MDFYFNPLSYLPQGGNDKLTPAPLGEGREGGKLNKQHIKGN